MNLLNAQICRLATLVTLGGWMALCSQAADIAGSPVTQVGEAAPFKKDPVNSIGMRLTLMPSPGSDNVAGSDRAAYISLSGVTREQWEAVMGKKPSKPKDPALPLAGVGAKEAKAFCRKLGRLEKRDYRPATEAEQAHLTGTILECPSSTGTGFHIVCTIDRSQGLYPPKLKNAYFINGKNVYPDNIQISYLNDFYDGEIGLLKLPPKPRFPKGMTAHGGRGQNQGGVATLKVTVGIDGVPASIKPVVGSQHRFNVAAANYVGEWRFKPATIDGHAVEVKMMVRVPFIAGQWKPEDYPHGDTPFPAMAY